MKKIILGIIGILAISIIIFLLQSPPIDPAAYTPPKSQEFVGVLAPNNLLQKAELLALGKVNGPEEVAVDSQGRIYGGTQDGKIIRLLPNGRLETFADTKGRPLGIQFDRNKNLIVCDSYKGLLSINPQGEIEVLATSADGVPFKFADALDIASDGTIYFTDASYKYSQNEYLYDLLESKPHGRFLSYDPATDQIKVLLKNLYFPPVSKLPKVLWPKPKPYGLVLAIDERGQITQSLHDPTGKHLKEITSAREYDGYLYLGSLHNDRIGKNKLPKRLIQPT